MIELKIKFEFLADILKVIFVFESIIKWNVWRIILILK